MGKSITETREGRLCTTTRRAKNPIRSIRSSAVSYRGGHSKGLTLMTYKKTLNRLTAFVGPPFSRIVISTVVDFCAKCSKRFGVRAFAGKLKLAANLAADGVHSTRACRGDSHVVALDNLRMDCFPRIDR